MSSSSPSRVHECRSDATERLHARTELLRDLLHAPIVLPPHSTVLELGCGTGSQTILLARNNPSTRIVAVDRSMRSLATARLGTLLWGLVNVEFGQANIEALPFAEGRFDQLFASFVLEDLVSPLDALGAGLRVMKAGGSITIVEGDRGSLLLHPGSSDAARVVACQAEVQRQAGGDPAIGRRLHPLLTSAGFCDVRVSPRVLYIDGSRPDLAEWADRAFVAMIEAIRDDAISARLISRRAFARGIDDLRRTIREGVFAYTFFKATARKPA